MKLYVSLLKSEIPRQVTTDACYEKDARERVCGLGGVLCDSLTWTRNNAVCLVNSMANK